MTYFKINVAHLTWLETEIAKGTIFYHHHSLSSPKWVPCGAYRKEGLSYDRLTAEEVSRMISINKNVYWRN